MERDHDALALQLSERHQACQTLAAKVQQLEVAVVKAEAEGKENGAMLNNTRVQLQRAQLESLQEQQRAQSAEKEV